MHIVPKWTHLNSMKKQRVKLKFYVLTQYNKYLQALRYAKVFFSKENASKEYSKKILQEARIWDDITSEK